MLTHDCTVQNGAGYERHQSHHHLGETQRQRLVFLFHAPAANKVLRYVHYNLQYYILGTRDECMCKIIYAQSIRRHFYYDTAIAIGRNGTILLRYIGIFRNIFRWAHTAQVIDQEKFCLSRVYCRMHLYVAPRGFRYYRTTDSSHRA